MRINTDYKLMASVLAFRLKKSLGSVIGAYQKGGVPGRLLFDNFFYIEMSSSRTEASDFVFPFATSSKAGIIGVDLAKAYDLVTGMYCGKS